MTSIDYQLFVFPTEKNEQLVVIGLCRVVMGYHGINTTSDYPGISPDNPCFGISLDNLGYPVLYGNKSG